MKLNFNGVTPFALWGGKKNHLMSDFDIDKQILRWESIQFTQAQDKDLIFPMDVRSLEIACWLYEIHLTNLLQTKSTQCIERNKNVTISETNDFYLSIETLKEFIQELMNERMRVLSQKNKWTSNCPYKIEWQWNHYTSAQIIQNTRWCIEAL